MMKSAITVETSINRSVEKVWQLFTEPGHIMKWNHATESWHSPSAENDLKPGGKFNYRMEARDGSVGFDFQGTFIEIEPHKKLSYKLADGRSVEVLFEKEDEAITCVTETFEAENENSLELQRQGWQLILDNFKKYVEKHQNE